MPRPRIFNKTVQSHNPVIIGLAVKIGSFRALAEAMGIQFSHLYEWARGEYPANFAAILASGRYEQANDAMLRLTGKTLADVFLPNATPTTYKPICDTHAACWHQHDALDFAFDLAKLTETLNQRQKAVLFGRMDGATLEEVGAELGVTRERVRMIECAARERVRKRMRILRYFQNRSCP